MQEACYFIMYTLILCALVKAYDQANNNGCSHDEFQCDGDLCVSLDDFCNGVIDCMDESDENVTGPGFMCLRGYGKSCLLPEHYRCDGIIHCEDKSDECTCASSTYFCDGKEDCPAGIDECFCADGKKSNSTYADQRCFRCLDGSKTIHLGNTCDGTIDCDDLSDECLCGSGHNPPICELINWVFKNGEEKTFSCFANASSYVYNISSICDGRLDCPSGIDEKDCALSSWFETDSQKANRLTGDHGKYECRNPESQNSFIRVQKSRKCDKIPTCPLLDDECDCDNSPEFCQYVRQRPLPGFFCGGENAPRLWGISVCDGVRQCENGEDEMGCPNSTRFYCDKSPNSTDNISRRKRCDLKKDCDDSSDELDCDVQCKNCKRCKHNHFYCRYGDPNGTRFVDCERKLCDGSEDCPAGEDECQNCTDGIFSNEERLIAATWILPFLCIISPIAIVGNLLVIAHSSMHAIRSGKTMTKIGKAQNSLMLHLAAADLLVGIYTGALIIQNANLSRGGYCRNDQDWRTSKMCSFLGVMLVVGSEGSVFILSIISAFRLNSAIRPFSQNSQLKYVHKIALFCWCMAIVLAVIPLAPSLENYFVETKWFESNPLISSVNREQVMEYTTRLIALSNLSDTYILRNGGIGSWRLFETIIVTLNPGYIPQRQFGYYSSHGVCLPKFFAIPSKDAAWSFTFVIILINFLIFFFIFASYLSIYREATACDISRSQQSRRFVKLQKKVSRIVLTDFLCWAPICIMAFLQTAGIKIPNDVYVPVGTILIPINSMLNPFLYSVMPDWCWEKTLPVRVRLSHCWNALRPSKKTVELVEMEVVNSGYVNSTIEETLTKEHSRYKARDDVL